MNPAPSSSSMLSSLDRVFEAANRLYEEANRQSFPTVDAVRKLARVNMSDASNGMKSWRRQQTTQVTPVGTIVPELLQQTSTAALATLWSQAVELANSTLRAAQAGWNEERIEGETLREQIAAAYETQFMELETAHAEIQALRTALQSAQAEQSELRIAHEQMQKDEALTRSALQRSEARAIEIERRADDLHIELERAHAELSMLRNDQEAYRQSHDQKVNELREEVKHIAQNRESREDDLRLALDTLHRETANLHKRLELIAPPNGSSPPRPSKSRSAKPT